MLSADWHVFLYMLKPLCVKRFFYKKLKRACVCVRVRMSPCTCIKRICARAHILLVSHNNKASFHLWCVEPMFQLCSAAEWKWPLVQAPVRFIKIKTRCWRTWRPAQLNILLLAKWNAVWNGHVNDTFCLCWLPCCIGWFSGHSTITCCHNGTGGC